MSQNDKSEGQQGPNDSEPWSPQQISQALREIARGEQTANALETNLSKLESKLDELLASFEGSAHETTTGEEAGASGSRSAREEEHGDEGKDLEKKTG